MKAELLSIGAAYFQMDSIQYPLIDPLPLKEYVGQEYLLSPGGSALNFAQVATSIGLQTIFVGKIGEDYLGEIAERLIADVGITPALIKSGNVQTNTAINYIDDKGKSIMFVSGTANQSLSPHEVQGKIDQYIEQIQFLYLGGSFKMKALLPAYQNIIEAAHSHNVKVCLDHGRVTNVTAPEDIETIRSVVPLVDYYFPSRDEFLSVWGHESLDEAIEKHHSVNRGVTVVKDAENGAIGISEGRIEKVSAFSVQVVNTVGAGDSFNAGFIKAQVDGLSLRDSLKFANATAALKISQKQLPTSDQIVKLIQ